MNRLTTRLRLTALYGGLFLLGCAMMLAVTYVLVERTLPRNHVDGFAATRLPPALVEELIDTSEEAEVEAARAALLEEVRTAQEEFREDTLESVLTQGAIALSGVGVVAVGLGWLLAGRVLAPVHRITETARRISASPAGRGLHERIALQGPHDELRELADTFDAMLERLDRSFDGQRRFVANASHEIRTPLALNRALVELAMTRPGASEDARQLGESLLAVNERHERLIDGLLMLADSENEMTERSPVDLADVARHVLGHATLPDGFEVERDLRAAQTAGDPVLIERLVYNLVENALRHNLPGSGWLSIATGARDGQATVTVANTGPEIPEYEVPVLFEPFRRRGRERAGGADRGFGLGLSIVRAIAQAHGGEVSAVPREGGGLTVTVSLPLEAELDPHAT